MQTFELTTVPLGGWNLLEANAGTGKTYSICGLYLRLILERSLSHDEIITITFTRAATGELRTRLMQTLVKAQQALTEKPSNEPDPIQQICAPFHGDTAALARIEQALRSFDLAPVLTIHSFCQRVLTESSLTTGFNVDAQVLDHQNEVLGDIVQAAWQTHLETLSAPLVRYLKKFNRKNLSAEISGLLGRPFAEIQGPDLHDPGHEVAAILQAREQALSVWETSEREIRDLLLSLQDGLSKVQYKPEMIARSLASVSAYLRSAVGNKPPAEVKKLRQDKLVKGTKKGKDIPQHPFFEAMLSCLEREEAFVEACEQYRLNLSRVLLNPVKSLLEVWKQSESCVTFDDLVLQLDDALKIPPVKVALIEQIQSRYGALLVDEYQDTDPVQARIFDHLFEPLGCPVWRVGDPKQSLYGFRGADLHAYLAARKASPNCYQLTQDWRAQPALVAVINQLFSRTEAPFILPDIQFAPAEPAPRAPMLLHIEDKVEPPMTVWPGGTGLDESAVSTASQIAQLISLGADGAAMLHQDGESTPLKAQHIAVLVRTNGQAQRIAAALLTLGIASSRPGNKSVFETAEADEFERLLHAVASPARSDRIAGALATRLLGLSANDLANWQLDEFAQDQWADQFRSWREIWVGQGVYPLLIAVLNEAGVSERILPLADGQSVMTNLLHLADLMETHTGSGYSVDEQLAWLNAERTAPPSRDESRIVRLDRDTNVVQIATIHRAKGAQYPVVFCPYLWRSHSVSKNYVEVHESGQLILDFGTEHQAGREDQQTQERISENSRLAYVALTRAEACVYLPWSIDRYSRTGESGLSHLLNPEQASTYGVPTGGKKDYQAIAQTFLNGFADAGARVLDQSPSFEGAIETPLRWPEHRQPRSRPLRRWQVSSYSSLFSGTSQDRDIDEHVVVEAAVPDSSDSSIFTLPAGAQTGLMLHELLENLPSFSPDSASLLSMAQHYLHQYSLEHRFAPAVADALYNLLHQPLGPDGLVLSEIGPADRLCEMEFHLRLSHLRSGDLWPVVRAQSPPDCFAQKAVEGFLHGFIDLIVLWQGKYWVIDYKSNHLGNEISDYQPQTLAEDVRLHNYDFQYHLYLLALDQHLKLSLSDYVAETHLGGVLYLYLRGIDSSGCGVHYAKPSASTLAALQKLLLK
ncbi:MAG: exodeoxyribonuclease V subunit beta [Lysobacterales bacterium]